MFEPQRHERHLGTERLMCHFKDVMLLLASPPTTLFILRLFYNLRGVGGDTNISKRNDKIEADADT